MRKDSDSKEVTEGSVTTLSQIFVAAGAAVLAGANPYIAGGGAMLSQFIGLRSKLKVNRIENFIVELSKCMKTIDLNFDMNNANSEDFGDFFEELLVKVGKTNSKEKLDRFKKIASGQIMNPIPYDKITKFAELANRLSDSQILILSYFIETDLFVQELRSFIKLDHGEKLRLTDLLGFQQSGRIKHVTEAETNDKISDLEESIKINKLKLEAVLKSRVKKFQKLRIVDLHFYLIDLRLAGLIYNPGEGTASDTGNLHYYDPTEFAKQFIEYLK